MSGYAAPVMPGKTQDKPIAHADGDNVVHALLFWLEGCGHCKKVMTEVLPPLKDTYGDRLDIEQIEVSDAEGSVLYDRATSLFGIKSGETGVPLLIIGDRVLVGSVQIPAELPGLVAAYSASGGVSFPAVLGLETARGNQPAAAETKDQGFALAWGVMLFMMASVIYAVLALILRAGRRAVPQGPAWLTLMIPALCIAGLAVAGYLSYIESTATQAFCGPVGNCNAVQSSPYSKLLGVLPIGILGAVGYVAILALWLWARLRNDWLAHAAPLAILALAFLGVLFSIYLTYLELFVILAVCIWCLSSAVIMALLLWLSIGPGLAATYDG